MVMTPNNWVQAPLGYLICELWNQSASALDPER
jgi:hypothetical protein